MVPVPHSQRRGAPVMAESSGAAPLFFGRRGELQFVVGTSTSERRDGMVENADESGVA